MFELNSILHFPAVVQPQTLLGELTAPPTPKSLIETGNVGSRKPWSPLPPIFWNPGYASCHDTLWYIWTFAKLRHAADSYSTYASTPLKYKECGEQISLEYIYSILHRRSRHSALEVDGGYPLSFDLDRRKFKATVGLGKVAPYIWFNRSLSNRWIENRYRMIIMDARVHESNHVINSSAEQNDLSKNEIRHVNWRVSLLSKTVSSRFN